MPPMLNLFLHLMFLNHLILVINQQEEPLDLEIHTSNDPSISNSGTNNKMLSLNL